METSSGDSVQERAARARGDREESMMSKVGVPRSTSHFSNSHSQQTTSAGEASGADQESESSDPPDSGLTPDQFWNILLLCILYAGIYDENRPVDHKSSHVDPLALFVFVVFVFCAQSSVDLPTCSTPPSTLWNNLVHVYCGSQLDYFRKTFCAKASELLETLPASTVHQKQLLFRKCTEFMNAISKTKLDSDSVEDQVCPNKNNVASTLDQANQIPKEGGESLKQLYQRSKEDVLIYSKRIYEPVSDPNQHNRFLQTDSSSGVEALKRTSIKSGRETNLKPVIPNLVQVYQDIQKDLYSSEIEKVIDKRNGISLQKMAKQIKPPIWQELQVGVDSRGISDGTASVSQSRVEEAIILSIANHDSELSSDEGYSSSIADENTRDEEVPITKKTEEPAADHSDKTRLQTALTDPHSIKKHYPRKQCVTTQYQAHHISLCELSAEYYLGQDALSKLACTKDPMQLKENKIAKCYNFFQVEVALSDLKHDLICEENNSLSGHDTLSDGCSIISSSPLSLTSSPSTTSLSTDRAESESAGYTSTPSTSDNDHPLKRRKVIRKRISKQAKPRHRNGYTSSSSDSSALTDSSSDTDAAICLSVPLPESVSSEVMSQESKETSDAANMDNQPHTMSNESEAYSSSQKSMPLTLAVAKPVQLPIHVGVQYLQGVELLTATTIHTAVTPMYQHMYPHFRFTHVLQQIDFSPNVHQTGGNNCLHVAVQNRHIWPLEFLLKKFELAELISRQNRRGFSPLCQAVVNEDHQATSVLLQELIRSQGICSISQAFPRDWIHDVTLPNLIHLYLCHPPSRWLVVAICKECGTEGSLPTLCIAGGGVPEYRGLVKTSNSPPKSTKLKVPGFLSSTNKKVASKQTASTQWSSGASAQALPHPVEAVDNSYSVLHCDHQVQPLQAMKTLVATEEVSGCCMKHKITKHFVTGVCQSSVLLKQLAEQHSDLATDNSASTNQHEGRGTSVVSPDSPLQHPNMQREQEEVRYNRHSDEPRSRNVDDRSRQDVQRSCRQPADVRRIESYQDVIATASQLLHVPDYEQMYVVLTTGFQNCPPDLPPQPILAFHFGCGLSEYKRGLLKEATASFNKLEAAARSVGRHGDVALANLYKGDIEFTQKAYLAAVANYNAAVENYSLPGSASIVESAAKDFRMVVPSLSVVNSKLGAAFRNASKPVDAIEWYKIAIENAKTHLSNTTETGITAAKKDELAAHTSLGNLYQSRNENAKALKEYEVAIELAEDLKDYISLGWAHGNMGNAYLGLHRKDEALFHLQKALDLAVEHEPTPQAIGRTYNNLGTAYQSMNDLDQAELNYDLALSQAIYGNDIPGQARVYGNIGNVLMLRKEFERAIPHYSEVLRLSEDHSTLSTALHNRGCAYYEWAENQRVKDKTPEGQFYLYGKDFEDCEPEHRPPKISPTVRSYYKEGSKDLTQVLKYHEENLESIKGSSKGLNLSVSLFESNSRTFHRLQDCLVSLGEWTTALAIAEQCRARTLGELMLKNRSRNVDELHLTTPLSLERIIDIVKATNMTIVYWTYTGARILSWVFVPNSENPSMAMFEVPVHDELFDGKSFDYHLRYALTEELVEHTFEMYSPADYDSKHNDPARKLYNLIGKPLMRVLNQLVPQHPAQEVQKIVMVPDSYTSLLPFSCLLDSERKTFLGDNFRFAIMPSLLTIGLVEALPPIVVEIPQDSQKFCIAGNPKIPQFKYNGDVWNLGKLPYAEKEAVWVSYKLNTTPILRDHATKNSVLMRIMNAKIIHFATHGSATQGFLAFAGMVSSRSEIADDKLVLLYPEEVEKLSISPALVVLSSCDSGRGTVKADGILGMARAFILAGAQAVLTSLWRVPDESASIFMQLFYQYLLDGHQASEALHKAILSLRCFSKYSEYIHWSGYQLTGRDIQIVSSKTVTTEILDKRLAPASGFPRLDIVKKLESAFIKDPQLPTDVQILRGPPGLRPSEIVKDFIHSSHEHFSGGIFWINCRQPDLIDASVGYIEKVIGTDIDQLPVSETQQALFVFDAITELPSSEKLHKLLKSSHVHIVFCSKSYNLPDTLIKDVDKKLIRGCTIQHIEPLSMVDSTQRIVYSVMKDHHLAPNNEDQNVFEELAEFTSGSPVIVEVASKSLLAHFKENPKCTAHEVLCKFAEAVSLHVDSVKNGSLTTSQSVRWSNVRCISALVKTEMSTLSGIQSQGHCILDMWDTNSQYDSWNSIGELINSCKLSAEEKFLLNTLCMFSCSPIPYSLVIELSLLIATASQQPHIAGTLSAKLQEMCLMKKYPSPVVLHPSLTKTECETEPEFVYVPQYISRSIWKNMEEIDRVVALSTMYQALLGVHQVAKPLDSCFFSGLCVLLLEMYEFDFPLMEKDCYKAVYSLYLDYKFRNVQSSEITAVAADAVSYKPYNREMNADRRLSYKPKLRLVDSSEEVTVVNPAPLLKPSPQIGLYSMKSKEHGVALIISNKQPDRDEENLIETFRFLGYRVEVRRQCSKSKLETLFDEIDTLTETTDDSFVCCLLAHGRENVVYGTDSKEVFLTSRSNSLEAKLMKCPKLHRKPKIFFVLPSCGTVFGGSRRRIHTDGGEDSPSFSHLGILYPVQPSSITAASDCDNGTHYVSTLCCVLCTNGPNTTLNDIYSMVQKEEEHLAGNSQNPKSQLHLEKNVYFFDDISE